MQQMNFFELLYPKFKFTKPIRLVEFFAGYGSQSLAMKYLGLDYESWRIVEWNYKSTEAYKYLHSQDDTDYSKELSDDEIRAFLFSMGISADWNKPMKKEQINRLKSKDLREIYNCIKATHNLVDISRVHAEQLDIEREREREHDWVFTYSFPCQDLSLAGHRKGMGKGSGTRSGLLWEFERIMKELTDLKERPEVLLMENVPQVHGLDNWGDFNAWQFSLEEMGYRSYWADLSADDFGIPQTRNRCFMVSLLGDYSYSFPEKQPLKLRLRDLLEDKVDRKYFLTEKQKARIIWK